MDTQNRPPLFVAAVAGEAAGLDDDAEVLITGIGTVPAAIALAEHLSRARERDELPSRVINLGTAGALHDGMVGVYEVEKVRKHDFKLQVVSDLSASLLPAVYECETSGTLPTTRLATGDMFVSDSGLRAELAQHSQLCDMEGYSIAAVCDRFGVPVTLLKQVSDSANEAAVGTWQDALDRAATQLADAVRGLNL